MVSEKRQVEGAKQRFSELLRLAAEEGAKFVTRHGKEVAIVVSIDEYRRLRGAPEDFKQFLKNAPDLAALRIERSAERTRPMEPE